MKFIGHEFPIRPSNQSDVTSMSGVVRDMPQSSSQISSPPISASNLFESSVQPNSESSPQHSPNLQMENTVRLDSTLLIKKFF